MNEERQFDFWLGAWQADWDAGSGTNIVESTFGGKVIRETFSGRPGIEFDGMSVSVYDRADNVWKQTWVDSDGNYLDFVGTFADGVMDLRRTALRDGRANTFRMRWYDIETDRFQWKWERSEDDSSWETMWAISYTRSL